MCIRDRSTAVSEGKMQGGEALEEIQKDEAGEGGADQGSGDGKEYPLPSEQAEREREAKEGSESLRVLPLRARRAASSESASTRALSRERTTTTDGLYSAVVLVAGMGAALTSAGHNREMSFSSCESHHWIDAPTRPSHVIFLYDFLS